MAVSSITGLGSGMDIDKLVSATADAEKAPKQAQIDRLTNQTKTTLTAVGTLKSALETFEASLSSLKATSGSFASLSASSADPKVASVSVGKGAVAGSYKLEVTSLASGSKVASASMSGGSSTTFASGGSLNIAIGNASYDVAVNAGASLTDIRDTINARLSSAAGISANIVNDANGSRLVLSSETTGADTDLYVTGSGDLAALNINVDAAGNHSLTQQSGTGAGYITKASNAAFTLDGLAMSTATNTTTALSGLSIKLEGTGSSTVSVAANTDGLKTSVESFVTAYNTLITVTNALTKVSASDDGSSTNAAALAGDASVRTLLNSVRSALVQPSSDSGGLSILSQLGVSTSRDGTLAIDDDKLSSSLAEHYQDVQAFFSGDKGLIKRLGDVTSVYTGSGGLIQMRENSLETTQTSLTKQQEDLNRRIDTLTTSLYSKYNKMDSLVSQLTATSNSIMTTLNALNKKDDD
ncbi:flagellar filament capping protein FliD [Azomonas macrocytogenes]|uniref:Flagellar hook-associated protein 2 n=1 Tax=Azomonas macrocytogenes TaxID=69962 RepID=A0A839T402_AZOMA|nr:flagellar filament capping protein FliD [Azomonas macrocytogenes]MBB3104142.1 flagellar hook-associated protein 2 [Azomonas macrocytogenes]